MVRDQARGCEQVVRVSWSRLFTCAAVRARVVGETELPDLHFIARDEQGLIDSDPVDVGAVEAADVPDQVSVRGEEELRVFAGDGDVIEENIRYRMASDGGWCGGAV